MLLASRLPGNKTQLSNVIHTTWHMPVVFSLLILYFESTYNYLQPLPASSPRNPCSVSTNPSLLSYMFNFTVESLKSNLLAERPELFHLSSPGRPVQPPAPQPPFQHSCLAGYLRNTHYTLHIAVIVKSVFSLPLNYLSQNSMVSLLQLLNAKGASLFSTSSQASELR